MSETSILFKKEFRDCMYENMWTYMNSDMIENIFSQLRIPMKVGKKRDIYDKNFTYGQSLGMLLQDSVTLRTHEIPKRLSLAGKADIIIATGFFTDSPGSVDLLVAGNKIDPKKFSQILTGIESDLGREIRYTLMATDEFIYRLNMYDQFLRGILDFSHEKLLIKIQHPDL